MNTLSDWIVLTVVVAVIWKLLERKKQSNQKARRANIPAIARWSFTYTAGTGEITSRTVRVQHYYHQNNNIRAWCELRDDERSFYLDRMRDVTDAETGQPVDLPAWIASHRPRRGRPPKKS
jgi:hypothetical protein